MKVNIRRDKCMGCEMCQGIAGDVFKVNGLGYSEEIGPVKASNLREVKDAIRSCPMQAISLSPGFFKGKSAK
ncbi:MAG: ferredoxin [Oscillospiraceae bacterium]|jgi:ferredoxin|nr:ferredoxin [Oscillospiraceae bacterium]